MSSPRLDSPLEDAEATGPREAADPITPEMLEAMTMTRPRAAPVPDEAALEMREHLLHTLSWCEVTTFIHQEGLLDEKYRGSGWLREFTEPSKPTAHGKPAFVSFTSSREEFMGDSTLTLQRLQSYEMDLRLHELAMTMLDLPDTLRECYIFICAELKARNSSADSSAGTMPRASEPADRPTASDGARSRHSELATALLSQKMRHEATVAIAAAEIDFSPTASRASRENLEAVIEEANTTYGKKVVRTVLLTFDILVKTDRPEWSRLALFAHDGEWFQFMLFLCIGSSFAKYRLFVRRVRDFVQIVTGTTRQADPSQDQTTAVKLLFGELRKFGATKWEQFAPLYRKIQDLNETVESQKQMITALAYRHLMEHLPDQEYYNTVAPNKKKDKLNEKDCWQLLWNDMVKKELDQMLHGDFTQRDLTTLFEYSFKLWRRDHKSDPDIPPETYKKWPNFLRGEGLYGELSNNIHLFQGQQESAYNIHDSNWSRTDRTILYALKPKSWPKKGADNHDEVDGGVHWPTERKEKSLPGKHS